MANLKEIRNRIVSVSSTMQITSAMKMVSAAKLKKAQDAITSMRPYASTLNNLIRNLSSSLEANALPIVAIRLKSRSRERALFTSLPIFPFAPNKATLIKRVLLLESINLDY